MIDAGGLNLRTALNISVFRHRTVLLASGAVLAALLVLATTPHGGARHMARSPVSALSDPIVNAGTTVPINVTERTVLARALQGRSGLFAKNAASPALSGISTHLVAGQRAFSIRVAEDDIVGGFLQSGDRVDVIATIPGAAFPQKDLMNVADRSSVLLLLQDIAVLAVGNSLTATGAAQTDARTVSLSLAPDQLVRLGLALRLGRVSLAIRRPGDDSISTTVPATLADLVPAERATPAPQLHQVAAKSSGFQIPFYAGAHATQMRMGSGQ